MFARHSQTQFKPRVGFVLTLLLVLVVLLLTGLGVFRLYFDFQWLAAQSDGAELFTLRVFSGNSLNLFEAAPFTRYFWLSLAVFTSVTVLMPQFHLIGGSLLAAAAAALMLLMHFQTTSEVILIPLEFKLFILLILYLVYVLLSFWAEIRDRKRVSSLLNQYIPESLSNAYRRDPGIMQRTGEEREISVFFCDIVGFSAVARQLETRKLADWLNQYFSFISRIVVRHGGSIDKYMGDSVMAVWGAPLPSSTHAHDALNAALDIVAELDELNAGYASQQLPAVSLGIGLSTGQAMVGPLGSEQRMDFTVIGDTVNIAQRLEVLTRQYGVSLIVSQNTVDALPAYVFRELDSISVSGVSQVVNAFQPLGLSAHLPDLTRQLLADHGAAMEASRQGQWDLAARLFADLREQWGPAQMYDVYLQGIEVAKHR